MLYLEEIARDQLAKFAAVVIEQHQSPIKELNFSKFQWKNGLTSSEKRLVEAICNSGETQLSKLMLGLNTGWWNSRSCKALLFDFVLSQQCLVELELMTAKLDSKQTEELLSFLCTSSNCATIEELDLGYYACNFDTDQACENLVELVSTAPRIKYCGISEQIGRKRSVYLKIEYAVEADPNDASAVSKEGKIQVLNEEGSKVIYESATKRTITQELRFR